jgi:hypothetical protein
MIRRAALAVVAALALGAAACSSSTGATKPTFTFSTATTTTLLPPGTASPTTIPVSTTAPTGETGQAVSAAACRVGQLRITAGVDHGAAGNAGQTIVFTNVGPSPCVMGGYPGVAALNARGSQVAQARRQAAGMTGGLSNADSPIPVVTLEPGQSASAEIEGSDVGPAGSATCATYPAFLVTPPGETHSVKVTLMAGGAFPGCQPIAINPVVPGVTGRAE